MARLEIVSTYCDGPCGGNEITGDHPSTWTITRTDRVQRVVDLCAPCTDALTVLFDRGTAPSQRFRPRPTPVLPGRYDTVEQWRDDVVQRRFAVASTPPAGLTVRAA